MADIYVDGDACPVKNEVYRAALRHDLKVVVVACTSLHVPARGRFERVRVKQGAGAADDWIAGHAGRDDIVVTADVPLAARCLKNGARVLAPNGQIFTEDSIGDALATRDLMEHLRSMGAVTGGPKPFAAADRSRFVQRLGEIIQAALRAKQGGR